MAIFSSNSGKKVKEKEVSTDFFANSEENTNGVSTISMETSIKGVIETNSRFQLDGVLEGDIKGASLVHIGDMGKVQGNIEAESVLIDGKVYGEITAHKVEIGPKGEAYATITSAIFVIQEGGTFEGSKKMKIALIKDEPKKAKDEKTAPAVDQKTKENKEL